MSGVAWERLRLVGFGRYRRVEVRFATGLQTWIAPNEAGKSTAVLGLLATVWGLPHVQDPHALTWARFRSWSGGPHRGAVTLRGRDGRRYTVTREFDRHAVRVVAHGPELDQVVVEGNHNPNARKEASPFGPWLASAVGMQDLSLVLATFVVSQDATAPAHHRLEDGVQALVSGAGGGTYRAALERLAEGLRERTRSLRRLGIGLADLRNDRVVERLEATVAAGRRALEAGRAAADGAQLAQRAVAQAEEAYVAARSEAERLRGSVMAQRSWVDRRESVRREWARARDARRALERGRDLMQAVASAREELDATWPAFADAPEGAAGALEALATARRRLSDAGAALGVAEAALQARRAEAAAALHDVAERDSQLHSDSRDWSAMGEHAAAAVLRLRRAGGSLFRQVEAIRTARARLREAEEELAPIAVFRDLDDADRELLEGYAARGRALAERLVRARTVHDELEERMRRHAAAFAGVRALSDEQVDALRAFEQAWEARRDPWAYRVAAAVSGGVAGAYGVPLLLGALGLGPAPWVPWLGAVAVAGAAALAVPRIDATRAAREELRACGVTGDDETLRQRLRQREAFEAQGAQVDADALAFEEAQREMEEAEAAGVDFRDAVARFRADLRYDIELDVAYARWKVLAPRLEREREALRIQMLDLAHASVDELERVPAAAAGEAAAELARFAAFQGAFDAPLGTAAEHVTLVELAAWLGRLSDATWEHWSRSAEEHDRARAQRLERRRDRRSARDLWTQRLRDAEEVLEQAKGVHRSAERAEAEATAALGWLWPRLATRGGPEDAPQIEATSDDGGLIDEDEVPAAGIAGLGPDPAAGAAAPWDPQVLRRGWEERRRAEEAVLVELRALQAHLAASAAEDPQELERALEHAELAAGAALARWQDLVATHPDLPQADPGEADSAEQGFRRAETLAAEAEQCERSAHDALLSAQRELARRQGIEQVNVAAVELAIAEAAAETQRVREEVDALALAYQELGAAVEDFRHEHRQRLEDAASRYFARFSRVADRRVTLDDDLAARVREPGGELAVPAQLSQGARDQLMLSLRLAVADLLSGEVRLPLIFDDPFHNWDEERLQGLRETLEELADERQVLVLSHRPSLRTWGRPVELEVS